MPATQLQGVIRHLSLAVVARNSAGVTDAQLLERFIARHDEAAFELLVWRHGKMVLGTCRRLLRDAHDAEDAFQACFLALARRAGSVGRRGSVGGWLHKVAFRLALGAKSRRVKRDAREQSLGDLSPTAASPDPSADAAWREVRRVLDDEVNRLPDTYRVPFVLCCLEGRSNADAARELGCALGTIESRLSRARERLRVGLTRRGVAPSAGLLAALPGPNALATFVPAALVSSAAQAATLVAAGDVTAAGLLSTQVVAMTEGVLRAMFMTKVKAAAVVLLAVALAGAGTGVLTYRTAAAGDQPGPALGAQPSQAPAEADPAQIARLIDQLGSDVFADRQKATKELEEIGVPALDALRKAAQGGDPERRQRAEELVIKFERQLETARLLAPKRVRLVYRDTPLAEAVTDFTTKSGYDIALSDPEHKLKDRKVTLDTGDVTFWKALDLFCQKAGVVEVPPPAGPPLPQGAQGGGGGGGMARAGGGGGGGGGPMASGNAAWPFDGSPPQPFIGRVLLVDGIAPIRPTDDSGVARVRDNAGPLATPAEGEIVLALEVVTEPRLRWLQTLGVNVTKAIDDQGRNLEAVAGGNEVPAPPRGGGGGMAAGPLPGGMGRSIQIGGSAGPPVRVGPTPIRLKTGGRAVKSLAELSGTITAQVTEASQPLIAIDEVFKSTGQTVEGAGGSALKIINITRPAIGPISFRVVLSPPTDLIPADASLRLSHNARGITMSKAGTAPGDPHLELALVDAKGQVLQPIGLAYEMFAAKSPEYVVTWQPAAGQGEPAKLVLSASKSITIDVPFALKNVPLP